MSKPVEDNTRKDSPKPSDPSWKPGGNSASPAVTLPGTSASPPISKTPGDKQPDEKSPAEKVPPKSGMSGPVTPK
ncbi:MAG TPA: hypothetical protein VFY24_14840 [Azospira sp.]|nr:hypothetical protein [Azospira sp.]